MFFSFLFWLLGVLCPLPLSLSRRFPRPWSVPPAPLSPRGAVAPSVCRSARRVGRFLALWRWSGFRRPPLRVGSPVPGVAAWFLLSGSVRCARRRLGCAAPRRGWFPSRWPRRPRPLGVVALPVRWPPASLRLVSCPRALSRASAFPVSRRRAGRGGRVFRWPAAVARVSPASVRGGRRVARGWPLGGRGVCAGYRSFRAFRRAWCVGFFRRRFWFGSRRFRRSFSGLGSRRRQWWPRFRVRGVSRRALSGWLGSFCFRFRLLLWSRFRFLGVRRAGRWPGFAGGRLSVRVFHAPAVGCLASRRFRCVGGRFFVFNKIMHFSIEFNAFTHYNYY